MARRLLLLVAIVAGGLSLRLFGPHAGLPFSIVKYGGSLLWGAMVFFIVALMRPALQRCTVAFMALAIAILVELFRLIHTPWLDDFRLTLAGALLSGRIFSLWNVVAYAAGIASGVWIDRLAEMWRPD